MDVDLPEQGNDIGAKKASNFTGSVFNSQVKKVSKTIRERRDKTGAESLIGVQEEGEHSVNNQSNYNNARLLLNSRISNTYEANLVINQHQTISGEYRLIAQKNTIFDKQLIKVDCHTNDNSHVDMTTKFVKHLGTGAFGVVSHYKILIHDNQCFQDVAIKKIVLKHDKINRIKEFEKWKLFINKLDYNNHLLGALFALQGKHYLLEVMPLGVCLYKCLWRLAENHKKDQGCKKKHHFGCDLIPIPEQHRAYANIFSGVLYLHRQNLIHGDIKPRNIILFNGRIMLSDFGTLREENTSVQSETGTHGFKAPEVYMRHQRCKSDIYSVGRSIAVIAGFEFFKTDGRYQSIDEIQNRDNELATMMNIPSLVQFGIHKMFVMATNHNINKRAAITDLMGANNEGMKLVLQQQQLQAQHQDDECMDMS